MTTTLQNSSELLAHLLALFGDMPRNEISRQAGISSSTLGKISKGEDPLTPRVQGKLRNAYERSLEGQNLDANGKAAWMEEFDSRVAVLLEAQAQNPALRRQKYQFKEL
jgi:hypothetical protein